MPIHRTIKNVVKNHTLAEVKVREATSNDPWGPSATLMSQIADLTYNGVAFAEVMSMLWKRLNDHGRNWRHVYKSLVLLDYLLKTGSEQVVDYCRDNVHHIRTLRDFQHVEEGKDHGVSIRERAKQISVLLEDDERYKSERAKTLAARERYAQNTGIKITNRTEIRQMPASAAANHRLSMPPNLKSSKSLRPELEAARPSSVGEEDLQLQVALAMSREEHQELEKMRKTDLLKVEMAVEESRRVIAAAAKSHSPTKSDSPPRLLPPFSAASNGQKPALSVVPHSADPWSPVPANSKPLSTAPVNSDPWSPVQRSSKAWPPSGAPAAQTDPWGAPVLTAAPELLADGTDFAKDRIEAVTVGNASVSFQPQISSTQRENLDDEFDRLGSRFRSQLSVTQNNASSASILRDSGVAASPWDVPSSSFEGAEFAKKKTAEEFLGNNANLVNLKELVAKPPPQLSNSNPFAMSTRPAISSTLALDPSTRGQFGQPIFHPLPSALPPSFPVPSHVAQATSILPTPAASAWPTEFPDPRQPSLNPLPPFQNSRNPFL